MRCRSLGQKPRQLWVGASHVINIASAMRLVCFINAGLMFLPEVGDLSRAQAVACVVVLNKSFNVYLPTGDWLAFV
jgi:hypothetical protein